MPGLSSGQNFRFFINSDVYIPRLTSNAIYKEAFNGIVDGHLDFNTVIYKGLYAGIGGKVTQIQYKEYRYGEMATTNLITNGHFKVGYLFKKTKSLVNVSLSYGRSRNNFRSLKLDTLARPSPNSSAYHFEPSVGIYWYIDEEERFLIGGSMSYNIFYTAFNPYSVALDVNSSYAFTPNDYKGNTQYFNVGLGFIYGFGGKKKAQPGAGNTEE